MIWGKARFFWGIGGLAQRGKELVTSAKQRPPTAVTAATLSAMCIPVSSHPIVSSRLYDCDYITSMAMTTEKHFELRVITRCKYLH
jgi:hypothetical protein